jgi:hypothetical protein
MYHLIFKSGEIKDITDEQGETLLKAFCLGKDKFILNKELRNFSSVSDIKPVRNEEYPMLPASNSVIVSKEKYLKHLNDLKGGFLKHFGSRKLPEKSDAILKKIDATISQANSLPSDYKFKEVRAGLLYV